MSVFIVPDGLAGERVDAALARMTGMSRSRVAELIAEGAVLLDGKPAPKASIRVSAGTLVDVDMSEPVRSPALRAELADGLVIVYEDPQLVVVDKPAGVAAHPSLGWDGPDVLSHLEAAGVPVTTSGAAERQGIVQRLDVGTSGLMVVAKGEHAYSALKQQFRDRRVTKIYLALVQGRLDPLSGTIDAPIGRHPSSAWKFAVTAGGRQSVTHYETIEAHAAVSLLRVHLETGRTHQIRVHLAALRHPCVGDPLYGADPVLASRLGLERQWLHAAQLGFRHPETGDWIEFDSAPATDLQTALDTARGDYG
ncbi:MAG: RluA family pseudouridine synthase [Propionibacteriaceae bacterium]|jgi:23S rRNA pseudouridine1911/1915/1917 synthase|nr:RluA family pseudouridine synthase [Propionibacteriaceae bacterium]